MNQAKFQMYNIITPKESDISDIANYIIDNEIVSLPFKLKNSLSLASYLMKQNYLYLLDLKFSDVVYNQIKLNDFVEYIVRRRNSLLYPKLPNVFKKNPDFYNAILKQDHMALYYIIDNIDTNIYNKLDKKILADVINNLYFSSEPALISDDLELLKIMMSKENGWINFKLFNERVLLACGLDKIVDYIINCKDYNQYSYIPKVVLNDRELISKICNNVEKYKITSIISDKNLSADNKYYLLVNYESYGFDENDTDGLANYVINNKITNIKGQNVKKAIFSILLDKKYQSFFDIYAKESFNDDMDIQTKEKLIDLFYNSSYTGTLSYDIQEIIFNSPKSLENITKIGDIIINNNIMFDASWPCKNSIELFNYLYDKKYENLLSLNFNQHVFESIPIEKLRAFYKEHPSIPIRSINLNLRMKIQDVNLDNIDYKKGKFIILYEERNNAQFEMIQYDGLSQDICNLLSTYPPNQVYDMLSRKLKKVEIVMNLSEHDILNLFANYQSNPSDNEEKIINLVRSFCSKQKELIAQNRLKSHMNDIRAKSTKTDNTNINKKIRIKKRKALYSQFIVDTFLNNSKDNENDYLMFNQLITSLGLDKLGISEFALITKIINGDEIIQKPNFYDKLEKHRITLRLNNNYDKLLINIINDNSVYRQQIVDFIKGNMSYEEMRKIIDINSLKTLHEIRNLYTESESELIELNGAISFEDSYKLSAEEITVCRQYESHIQAINKLRKHLNKDMNERFPLDSIKINAIDYDDYSNETDDQNVYLDPLKIYEIDRVLLLFNIKDNYTNQKSKDAFNKLFVDSGIIYGLPFVSSDLFYKMYEVAENMSTILDKFDEKMLDINNLSEIIKNVDVLKYLLPYNEAILGEKIISEIVNGDTFITDKTIDAKKKRVEDGAKYISLAGRNIMSTIPYTRVETDEFVAERYRSDNPEILTTGIKTDACFRLYGNDNDFLLYTMFNKNGIVVRIGDKSGNFIGRMSGFRNGNTVYFNQLRTIYDTHGNPSKTMIENIQKIRDCAEKYANDLIESTKESAEPIENVLILRAYGYANCDYLPTIDFYNRDPMSVDTSDFKDFKKDPELILLERDNDFTTDYNNHLPVLLLASDDSKKFSIVNDSYTHDTKAIYNRPRKKPTFYKQDDIDDSLLADINCINAKNIYWGSKEDRETAKKLFSLLKSYNNIDRAVVGDDFYIFIDKYGNVHELCLPYDSRAYEEFNKYKEIIFNAYESNVYKTK